LPKPVEPKQPDPIDLSALTAPAIPTTSPEPPGRQAPQQKSQTAAAPASRPSPPPAPPPAAAAPQAAKPQSADAPQPAPSPQTPSQPQQPPPVPPAPEPDVTVKYGVMLGLPAANPPAGKEYDGVEAPAFETAKVEANDIAAFRRHLKTCSTLPAAVAPTDKVRIVLRVLLSRDGRLVAEPALLEASASAKGPVLMQRAMDALQACQPYTMLPADKYKEWKVLDLSFTPQDFTAGG
jgi:hypothetical protein